jgi:hypothetical protein
LIGQILDEGAAAVGWNDHVDNELSDLLEELTVEGYVLEGTPAFEVAKKVIAQGKGSLTGPEQAVFKDEVVPAVRALAQARERRELNDASAVSSDEGNGDG